MRVIAGTARSVPLLTREGLETRPTTDRVKESEFNIIQFEIPGSTVLDLFGGSGQLGIECLSRGAKEAVIVDANHEAVCMIRENLRRTKLADKAEVVQADYLSYLSKCTKRFHLIFLDPPYRENFLENALKRISEIDILHSGGIILCEHPSDKVDFAEYAGIKRGKTYRYGKTALTVFRKEQDHTSLFHKSQEETTI